jgi:hypothetical protein
MFDLPEPQARWLIFARAGDSIELEAWADRERSVPDAIARLSTSAGTQSDSHNNTARHFFGRAKTDGLLTARVVMDDDLGDSVAYTLRISRPDESSLRRYLVVGAARLIVSGPGDHDEFSIMPLSDARDHASNRNAWKYYVGSFEIALTADSLYEFCSVPCRVPDTIKLKPGYRVQRSIR